MIHRSENVMPQFGDSGSAVLLERGREPHCLRLQIRAWGGEKAICGARAPAGLFHPMLTRAGALVCPRATFSKCLELVGPSFHGAFVVDERATSAALIRSKDNGSFWTPACKSEFAMPASSHLFSGPGVECAQMTKVQR
jgi:hypothetical protein